MYICVYIYIYMYIYITIGVTQTASTNSISHAGRFLHPGSGREQGARPREYLNVIVECAYNL